LERERHASAKQWLEAIEMKSYEEKEGLFARVSVGSLAYRLERSSEPNGSRAKMLLRVAGMLVVFFNGLDCFPCN
jgi:hypothetical protein